MEEGKVVKTQIACDRVYEWTIYPLSILLSKYQDLPIEMNYKCFQCELQGQFYWQTKGDYHMYYYCPRCKKVWTVNMKEKVSKWEVK